MSAFNAKTPQKRIDILVEQFGVEVVNLTIERHQLATEKRDWFIVRYVEEDAQKEREYTEKMDKLTEKISVIDEKLYRKGIEKDWRLRILRDIKKVYPQEWQTGFTNAGETKYSTNK